METKIIEGPGALDRVERTDGLVVLGPGDDVARSSATHSAAVAAGRDVLGHARGHGPPELTESGGICPAFGSA